jgi:hypothetical protein
MRSKEELEKFLEACFDVAGFGLSNGPCPLQVNEEKTCLENCDFKEGSDERISCCMSHDEHRGCCAECSFPSAIKWVLGDENNPTDNGQKRLFQAIVEGK